jgi:outer membrane protein assembly factor BamA
MNMKSFTILIILILLWNSPMKAQLVKVEDFTPRRADTIILERNWRTRNRIILAELQFVKNDTVTPETLAISLKKIWNLQNFASVGYRWDSLPDGRSALILTTRDALTIIPVIGGRFQMPDMTVKAGIADRNFLGRNIRVEVRGQYSTNEPMFGEIKFLVPRQLLWGNMALGAGVRREDIRIDHIVSDQANVSIINPFNQDYHYTFSPDIETGWIRHKSFLPVGAEEENYQPSNRSFWFLRITESIGTITHRRHQEEGFMLTAMIGTGVGLNTGTRSFFQGSIRAEYNHLITRRLQYSILCRGNIISTNYKSLWTRYGPGIIRGIEYGEISGPMMQSASAGLYYTWLNMDFLAIEQSFFLQYASALKSIGDWSSVMHHYAICTGLQFTIPMYPAASLLLTFSYNPHRNNWFYLEM